MHHSDLGYREQRRVHSSIRTHKPNSGASNQSRSPRERSRGLDLTVHDARHDKGRFFSSAGHQVAEQRQPSRGLARIRWRSQAQRIIDGLGICSRSPESPRRRMSTSRDGVQVREYLQWRPRPRLHLTRDFTRQCLRRGEHAAHRRIIRHRYVCAIQGRRRLGSVHPRPRREVGGRCSHVSPPQQIIDRFPGGCRAVGNGGHRGQSRDHVTYRGRHAATLVACVDAFGPHGRLEFG